MLINDKRALVYVVEINDIVPIKDADKIETAVIKGWKVVVKKNQFKPGDKAIYFEIDSFLPIKPEFEFLRASSYRKLGELEGFRLKTIKLRKQISQGLIMSFSDLNIEPCDVNTDLTDIIGVVKWEIPETGFTPSGKVSLGNPFPYFIPKTDEERVQNYEIEYYLKDLTLDDLYITEKIDGSSITVYVNRNNPDRIFGVCSRNRDIDKDEQNMFWENVIKLNLEEKMLNIGFNFAIQGELHGIGIQNNPYKMMNRNILWYTGYNIDKQERMNYFEFKDILNKLGLNMVPELSIDPIKNKNIFDRDMWLEFAENKSTLADVDREGVVVRAKNDTSISFKAVSNKYLLKYD